ncbi:group III truncated hemoglobin [Oceanicoccus sp. KOV_DT_Chl]|uniref:group III truncated hemoglobin n=1 Tax=Oceanicoccus sp. KOV_DT_Chl TaxID=1904639 RepID=UPI000C7DF91F|nr:group III truncated hemoglobin [Oceanicoccus sp. KOV_DT_Chl]
MPIAKNDIQTTADIDRLIQHFYDSMLEDPIVGFFFTDIARINLAQHLPRISKFWQRQLLGLNHYQGRTFEIHQQLHQRAELNADHFHRWLFLFEQAVNSLFAGERAELAIGKSRAIAQSMLQGLQDRQMETVLKNREQQGLQFFNPKP